ncbi:MAG: hypothetical protein ISR65_14105 [Bacteriovoracaceae bacterium]|nr:hypothetical protein [Bacteriovoracaceae bacterium]
MNKKGVFSGRVSKLNMKASFVRVKVDFNNMKYINKHDVIEIFHGINDSVRCKSYVFGKTSEYLLLKVSDINFCFNNVGINLGGYLRFYSEDLVNNLKVGKELFALLLKKRLAVQSLMHKYKKELEAHVEKAGAVNDRYNILQDKLRGEWEHELLLLEEDRSNAFMKFSKLEAELIDLDHKMEQYRIDEDNLAVDRWALDSKQYYRK